MSTKLRSSGSRNLSEGRLSESRNLRRGVAAIFFLTSFNRGRGQALRTLWIRYWLRQQETKSTISYGNVFRQKDTYRSQRQPPPPKCTPRLRTWLDKNKVYDFLTDFTLTFFPSFTVIKSNNNDSSFDNVIIFTQVITLCSVSESEVFSLWGTNFVTGRMCSKCQ